MPSDSVEDLLQNDFDALAVQLDKDRFADRVLFKLSAKSRARQGIVFFAGGLGAAFAASQFSGVVETVSFQLAETSLNANPAFGELSHIAATLLLAGALAATVLVLRHEA